ncbi:unnamed protein product [Rhodiola kirilowii]
MAKDEDSDDDMVCLDESFFINDDYQLATFTFGSHTLELFCLQSASTDFDLTGQIIWPGAMLMNDFLSKNVHILQGCSVIELGSGADIEENIQHHTSYEDNNGCAGECLSFNNIASNPLFQTVEKLIRARGGTHCKFILAYVSRSKTMDALVLNEAAVHNMSVHEIPETRSIVGNLEGELITACTISSMFHKVKKEKGSMDVNNIGPGGLFHAAF